MSAEPPELILVSPGVYKVAPIFRDGHRLYHSPFATDDDDEGWEICLDCGAESGDPDLDKTCTEPGRNLKPHDR